ncbi:hypothetical protein MPSEU_000364700 [Mayamaea pseudoterrestris]|nr:hypothetical protein MPSEU_000364700 [Mayamaea pseudoterrestris]
MNRLMNESLGFDTVSDVWSHLKESLSQNLAILSDERCSDAARHAACQHLLDAFAASLISLDSHFEQDNLQMEQYEQVWLDVFVDSGLFATPQLRLLLLRVLQNSSQLRRFEILHFILSRLPTVMPPHQDPLEEQIVHQVFILLKNTIQKQPNSLLSFLESMTRMHLGDETRDQVIDFATEQLVTARSSDLIAIVRNILYLVMTDEHIAAVWAALKQRMHLMQATRHSSDILTEIAHELCKSFQDASTGLWMSQSYVKHAGKNQEESGTIITVLEVILLTLLGSELPDTFAEPVENIMHIWLRGDLFPFHALQVYVLHLSDCSSHHGEVVDKTTGVMCRRLAHSLMRFVLPYHLTITRTAQFADRSIVDITRQMIIMLYLMLDREVRMDVIRTLMALIDPVQCGAHYDETISTNIYDILETLAECSVEEFSACKTILNDHLLSSSPSDDHHYQELCRLLVRIHSPEHDKILPGESNSLYKLLRQLFSLTNSKVTSSTASSTDYDATFAVRAISLATEIIRCPAALSQFPPEEQERVNEWVLTLMLPKTRCMVDPRVGAAGIEFIREWIEKYPTARHTMFQALKVILANTGLVQRRDLDQRPSVAAYTHFPGFLKIKASEKPVKSIEFCVAYYMRRAISINVYDSKPAVLWMFDLLDLYLQLGRTNTSKNWRFDGWLLAGIAFSDPQFPGVIDALGRKFMRFNEQSLFEVDLRVAWNSSRTVLCESDLVALVDSLLRYSHSLLIAAALTAAVLKNAFDDSHAWQFNDNHDSNRVRQRLLSLQVWKLFDMRRRLGAVSDLAKISQDVLNNNFSDEKSPSGKARARPIMPTVKDFALENLACLIRYLKILDTAIFFDKERLPRRVLWACVIDADDETEMLRSFADIKKFKDGPDRALVEFRTTMVCSLVIWLQRNGPGDQKSVELAQCAESSQRLVQILPTLRLQTAIKPMREFPDVVLQVVSLTLSYLRLVLAFLNDDDPYANASKFKVMPLAIQWLKITDNEHVATYILDILTAAMMPHCADSTADDVIGLSWASLHTIYVGEQNHSYDFVEPTIMSHFRVRRYEWTDVEGRKLKLQLDEHLVALTAEDSFMASNKRLIQHFGLLLLLQRISHYLRHMNYLLGELALCAKRSMISIVRQGGLKRNAVKKEALPPPPAIPFLTHGTCAGVLKVALDLTVWAIASMDIHGYDERPFWHYLSSATLFKQLLDVYCDSCHAFSPRCATAVCQASHRAVLAGVSVVKRCIEWRGLNVASLSKTIQGSTALAQLRELLYGIAANIVGRVTSLCDFFQKLERQDVRITGLRQVATKAMRTLNRLAATHNWPTPSYVPNNDINRIDGNMNVLTVKGFHERPYGDEENKLVVMDEFVAMEVGAPSSDESFAVAGDWGDYDSD